MQTFLPYADFSSSASVLDYRRLGKQRVESIQILRTLLGQPSRWANHPAVRQWRGFEVALVQYGQTICIEWINRGYVDNLYKKFEEIKRNEIKDPTFKKPPWLGLEPYHASHRSNLLRKDFEYYCFYQWKETPDLPYVWPSETLGVNTNDR